jgi:hypothetical protein
MDKSQISNYLIPSEWKFIHPKKRIKPRHIGVLKGRSIFIGGLIRIDFVDNIVNILFIFR